MNRLAPQDIQQLFQFALDHAEEAALWSDAEGRILYANAAACCALRFTAEEILENTLSKISPELTPELWSHLLKEVRTRKHFALELTLRSKENRLFAVDMTIHLVTLGKQDILCAFFRDVDELKRLQQLKNEFVSTVSHELRTPMTIVRESVSQVLDGLLGDVPPAQREALYVTLSGIDRLARIINNLLDVSKMEAGKATLRWDRINLVELIREIIETFSARARERGLELRLSFPPQSVIVYADYERLVQVFTNLVGNALKFTEKGRIEVSLRERDNEIECVVSDSGVGIAKEDLGRVFNKFEQLSHPAVTGEKGSGLGLSICKGIIELHQGRIWVESRPGQGSEFIFVLPKRTAADLFRQRLSAEVAQAALSGGNVTGVFLSIKSRPKDDRKTATLLDWALDELMETIKAHGARKTDFILKGVHGVWLCLNSMNKKEATRIIQRIQEMFAMDLEKNELKGGVQLAVNQCSFPEDVKTDKELMRVLIGDTPNAG